MAYSDIKDPSAHFQTKLWTGTGSSQTVNFDGNSNLQADWIWHKEQNDTNGWHQTDTSIGIANYLATQDTAAAYGVGSAYVSGIGSNSISYGGGDSSFNSNSVAQATWAWKANGGTTASNSDGTITSTTQVNSDAGFSIQTLTSASSGTSNWGHGLGQKPDWWVVKITGSGGGGWWLHHKSLTSGASSQYLGLHSTAAATSLSAFDASSSTITASADFVANSKAMVCYAFIEKQGYSKFGSYVGTSNVNGPFIYLGFKPAFVMIKRAVGGTSSYSSWAMFDNKRLGYNPTGGPQSLYANGTYAEGKRGQGSDNSSEVRIDMLSNGFKVRDGGSDEINDPGDTYIYMAFAEHPFVAGGVPTTAR